jgi:hypothetical protein
MQVRFYGLFDGVQKEYVRTFTFKNDEVAQRGCEYIVREPNFDKIAGRDYVLQYLYTWDSESGLVIDNNISTICSLGQALATFEAEQKEEKILSLLEEKKGEKNGRSKNSKANA